MQRGGICWVPVWSCKVYGDGAGQICAASDVIEERKTFPDLSVNQVHRSRVLVALLWLENMSNLNNTISLNSILWNLKHRSRILLAPPTWTNERNSYMLRPYFSSELFMFEVLSCLLYTVCLTKRRHCWRYNFKTRHNWNNQSINNLTTVDKIVIYRILSSILRIQAWSISDTFQVQCILSQIGTLQA